MKRRISGIDVNGWRDAAARDWDPDEFDTPADKVFVLDGGIGSVAVKTASADGERWIGGPQAAIAPHGRGRGWGQMLGGEERRVGLAESCDTLATGNGSFHGLAYAAAIEALSRAADQVVLGVPDVAVFGEAAQGRVLGLFKGGMRGHRLLWRPVAAFLHAMESGEIPVSGEGRSFRFLIHTGAGFEVQTLRLRRDSDRHDHLAPERQGPGEVCGGLQGLGAIVRRTEVLIAHANPVLAEQPSEKSRLALDLLLGRAEPGEVEVLRHDNGGWLKVTAPSLADSAILPDPDQAAAKVVVGPEGIDAHFLLTPLVPRWRERLLAQLSGIIPGLRLLEWDGLARGCLIAGQLIDRGLPHYYDKLTPIALAVLDSAMGEPRFAPLIEAEATLPANREYVSPPFGTLEWLGGKKDLAFYVLKGADEVRHWRVVLENPPPHNVAIELRLRQTPGQSWARLSLTSPDWEPLQRAPIQLDWAGLEPVQETPEEILEKLRLPPPTIPNRIVEQPHFDLWRGTDRYRGLIGAMQEMERKGGYDLGTLATLLPRSHRPPPDLVRHWSVGTDGNLPEHLLPRDKQSLHDVLARCEGQILGETLRKPLRNNHALRCATWVFTLCPESVQEALVSAIEASHAGRQHALVDGAPARITVVIQGAGRAVTGVRRLMRLLDVLSRMPPSANTLNALAMILSRRRESPAALTRAIVERLAVLLSAELQALAKRRSFKLRFRNALSALAGLFRYREIERHALVAQSDPIAQRLQAQLDDLASQLEQEKSLVPLFTERMNLLQNIQDYLKGQGHPDILLHIEDLDGDDE